jgi:hypothetical protein
VAGLVYWNPPIAPTAGGSAGRADSRLLPLLCFETSGESTCLSLLWTIPPVFAGPSMKIPKRGPIDPEAIKHILARSTEDEFIQVGVRTIQEIGQ